MIHIIHHKANMRWYAVCMEQNKKNALFNFLARLAANMYPVIQNYFMASEIGLPIFPLVDGIFNSWQMVEAISVI